MYLGLGEESCLVTKEDPPWLGPTQKKIFEIKPSRMAENAPPRLKFNKITTPLRIDSSTMLKKTLIFRKNLGGEDSCVG